MFKNLHEIFSTKANLNFACLDLGWGTFTVLHASHMNCTRSWAGHKNLFFKLHSKMLTLHIILFSTKKNFNETADKSSLFGGVS